MIERYQHPDLDAIWSRSGELARLCEAALACARVSGGRTLEREVGRTVRNKTAVNLKVWSDLEVKYDHDIAAFVEMVRRDLPEALRESWHRGRTSSDLVETALAVGVRDSGRVIQREVDALAKACARLAVRYRTSPVMGRTHGQAAEPTTIGRKFALLAVGIDDPAVLSHYNQAKLTGPVGVTAKRETHEIASALASIGLRATASTQIVPRWYLARYLTGLVPATMAMSALATEIRLGSRTPLPWLRERSPSEDARGSSAMPHKRNPIRSERAVGLLRLARSNIAAVVEAGAELWEERDISHSSVERTALVDALHLIAFVARDLTGVVSRLEVDEGAAKDLADQPTGVGTVEALIGSGCPYADAYEEVRRVGPVRASIIHGLDGRGLFYDPTSEPGLWAVTSSIIGDE